MWVVAMLSLYGCESITNREPTLATAYGNKLFLQDLSEDLSKVKEHSDSISLINDKVDEWVMDQMLLKVAKEKIGKKEQIVKMVEEYEKELYLHHYNQVLIKEELDTTITDVEIDTFISQQAEEYLLEDPMVKLLLIKVIANDESDALDDLWKTEDLPGLKTITNQLNGLSLLDPDKWHKVSEIKSLLPQKVNEEVNYKKPSSKVKIVGDDLFFVKILESRKAGETIPSSLIRPAVRQKILQLKSREMLREWKNNLYQNKIKSKDIIIKKLDLDSSLK